MLPLEVWLSILEEAAKSAPLRIFLGWRRVCTIWCDLWSGLPKPTLTLPRRKALQAQAQGFPVWVCLEEGVSGLSHVFHQGHFPPRWKFLLPQAPIWRIKNTRLEIDYAPTAAEEFTISRAEQKHTFRRANAQTFFFEHCQGLKINGPSFLHLRDCTAFYLKADIIVAYNSRLCIYRAHYVYAENCQIKVSHCSDIEMLHLHHSGLVQAQSGPATEKHIHRRWKGSEKVFLQGQERDHYFAALALPKKIELPPS